MNNSDSHQYRLLIKHLCDTLGIKSLHWYEVPKLIKVATEIMSYLDQKLYPQKKSGQLNVIQKFMEIMNDGNEKILNISYKPVLPNSIITKADASIINSIKYLPVSDSKFTYTRPIKTVVFECPDNYWTDLSVTGFTLAEEDIARFINGIKNPYNLVTEIRFLNNCYHYIEHGWEDDRKSNLVIDILNIFNRTKIIQLIINGETITLKDKSLLLEPDLEETVYDIEDIPQLILNDREDEGEVNEELSDSDKLSLSIQSFRTQMGISETVTDADFIFTWTSIMTAIHIELHYTWPGLFVSEPFKFNSDQYYVPKQIVNDWFWFNLR